MHFNGMSGQYYMAEVISPGGALVDYDNDGDLDLYLVQGRMLEPGKTAKDATFPAQHPLPLTDRLYRNDLAHDSRGRPVLQFTDVTESSGLETTTRYGVGVAAGDFDNDGWVDLYLTNLGPNQLLRSAGDGTFVDVTERAGVGDPGWSVPAAFFDYDRDGWLDLFSGNYVDFPFDDPVFCRDLTGAPDFCGPSSYVPQPDRLYRNRSDGTFEDVTAAAGLAGGAGGGSESGARPALGSIAADLDDDGWPDIYVANDGEPNSLWINNQDGTFSENGLISGCSVNANGKAEGSMGVDAADFDRDGDLDLFMTHIVAESNTLFLNEGQGLFRDHTAATGLAAPSRAHTSFGTGFLDYDNDGWLDLIAVNGAVRKIESLARTDDPYPIHELNQLFHNVGDGRFEEVSDIAGEVFALSEVSRGALLGDVDNDGDTDVAVVNNNGPARLLINNVGQDRSWLGVQLQAGTPPRDMPDTRATLLRAGASYLWGRVRIEGNYCAANDPRLLFGLGASEEDFGLRILWTDGRITVWPNVPTERYTRAFQGPA
ncbi:MAG: CRTAC1 family protein [bacterium]|nr:CRTAC1 family protein [bacterium]